MTNNAQKLIQKFTQLAGQQLILCLKPQSYQKVVKVLPEIKKLDIQQLFLNSIHLQKVINPFIHISFERLQTLDLSYNFITSIQCFIHLKAQSLAALRLQANYITETKSLRKCHFPRLKRMRIENNPLRELKLNECNFPQLQEIIMVNEGIEEEGLIKVVSKKMRFVMIRQTLRKKQIKQILRTRFQDIRVQCVSDQDGQSANQDFSDEQSNMTQNSGVLKEN